MKQAPDPLAFPRASCSEGMEEALNLYMDGELSFEEQPDLFGHLATCDVCRRLLGATLEFRRMRRQEVLMVPSAVDDAFFHRLDQVKRRSRRVDRSAERRPLWQARGSVSLRGATMAALLLFAAGLMFPADVGEALPANIVVGLQERVVFPRETSSRREAVYVFYPGLTVEANRIDELAP